MSTAKTVKPRKRIFYLDLIRALAVALIVLTHFNNPYLTNGNYLFFNEPFGIYIGNLGVSLFLIISGAALTFTYQRPLNLKKFFFKRFIGIYPMFWIAWVLGTIYFFLDSGGTPLNGGPPASVIFTVLGIDGLVANLHLPTTYLLGEWFLGFILIFYLVFPLLLWAIDRFPKTTAFVLICLYVITLFALDSHPSLPKAIFLPVRLPELAFGMYFMKYLHRVPFWLVVVSIIVLDISDIFPGMDEDIATTLVGISSFLILVFVADYFDFAPISTLINRLAKYSYPIFLVHHIVIMKIYTIVDVTAFTRFHFLILFAAVCIITCLLGYALNALSDVVVKTLRKKLTPVK